MTFFSHRSDFRSFPIFFKIFHIFGACNVVFHPFFTRKAPISENNSLMTPFLLCSCFRTHPTNTQNMGGDGCMGPYLKFGGTVPQSPPRSPSVGILGDCYGHWTRL